MGLALLRREFRLPTEHKVPRQERDRHILRGFSMRNLLQEVKGLKGRKDEEKILNYDKTIL